MDEEELINNFQQTSRMRSDEPKSNLPRDFFSYVVIRLIQFVRMLRVLIILLTNSLAEIKGFTIRRMYWGRTSFYRTAFQVLIVLITGVALITSISARTNIFTSKEEGIVASSGIIGNSDIFLQVGTTEAITQAQVSDVDYSIEKYTVEAGDTLSTIAEKFGVSADTIRWANGISAGRDTLSVGQALDIPPMNGVLYTVVKGDTLDKIINKVEKANKFDLIELNNLEGPDYAVNVGDKLFIPDATYAPPVIAKTNTSSYNYVNLGNTAVNVAPGTFVNPMQYCPGYTFARGWRYTHTGVDLAHSSGCWINSIGSGVVIKAGWCGSMGYCTAIRHDNGYSSLYMHGQGQFAVRAGERVGAGQQIMTLGCTGRCYGSHLHLSISSPGVDVISNYYGRINPAGIVPY